MKYWPECPINWATSWQIQQNECAPSEDSDQPGHPPLCAQWVAKDPGFLHADSEDSDQTGRMPRLIWVFAGRTATLLVLSWGGSIKVPLFQFISQFMKFCVFRLHAARMRRQLEYPPTQVHKRLFHLCKLVYHVLIVFFGGLSLLLSQICISFLQYLIYIYQCLHNVYTCILLSVKSWDISAGHNLTRWTMDKEIYPLIPESRVLFPRGSFCRRIQYNLNCCNSLNCLDADRIYPDDLLTRDGRRKGW